MGNILKVARKHTIPLQIALQQSLAAGILED
jgi:hypothetical protein